MCVTIFYRKKIRPLALLVALNIFDIGHLLIGVVQVLSFMLMMKSFYKREKMDKFFRHWAHRQGLETLKKMHILQYGHYPTEAQQKDMEAQVNKYIKDVNEFEDKLKYSDVYVTDHVAPEPKYVTLSEDEDEQHMQYVQSLKEYNDTSDKKKLMSFTKK